MIRKIGIVILQLLATIAFVAGLISLFEAINLPGSFRLGSASAVQITQVYSEATYIMLRAIAYMLTAVFIQIALHVGYPPANPQLAEVQKNTRATRTMVSKLGAMLQKD